MLYVATGDGSSYFSADPLALGRKSKDRLSGIPFTFCNPTCWRRTSSKR
jgi:hypothetical protein